VSLAVQICLFPGQIFWDSQPAMATVSDSPSSAHSSLSRSRNKNRRLECAPALDVGVLLDETYCKLSNIDLSRKEFHHTLDQFVLGLRESRNSMPAEQWEETILACRSHAVAGLLHEDPFTHRAFSKPRGYAGDAELLDYIYAEEELWPVPEASQLGRRVFEYTTRTPAPAGVRARRGFVADMIDRLADTIHKPHVLSIAAGHLREAVLAAAVKRKRLGRFTALDADQMSLEEIHRCYGCFGVETVAASIRQCVTGKLDLGQYDFIYSIGLFDYLNEATGRRLVSKLFHMLRPSGCLLVANFLPDVRDVGYMEAFMDWHLTYRSRQEMIGMTMEIPQSEIKGITIFAEENQNIIFLKVIRN
jgi:extracellular factor (EF) 3-hydroxypalmitic acid methyl ester biosynthesis protein